VPGHAALLSNNCLRCDGPWILLPGGFTLQPSAPQSNHQAAHILTEPTPSIASSIAQRSVSPEPAAHRIDRRSSNSYTQSSIPRLLWKEKQTFASTRTVACCQCVCQETPRSFVCICRDAGRGSRTTGTAVVSQAARHASVSCGPCFPSCSPLSRIAAEGCSCVTVDLKFVRRRACCRTGCLSRCTFHRP
jgi:hypothetical protein